MITVYIAMYTFTVPDLLDLNLWVYAALAIVPFTLLAFPCHPYPCLSHKYSNNMYRL